MPPDPPTLLCAFAHGGCFSLPFSSTYWECMAYANNHSGVYSALWFTYSCTCVDGDFMTQRGDAVLYMNSISMYIFNGQVNSFGASSSLVERLSPLLLPLLLRLEELPGVALLLFGGIVPFGGSTATYIIGMADLHWILVEEIVGHMPWELSRNVCISWDMEVESLVKSLKREARK